MALVDLLHILLQTLPDPDFVGLDETHVWQHIHWGFIFYLRGECCIIFVLWVDECIRRVPPSLRISHALVCLSSFHRYHGQKRLNFSSLVDENHMRNVFTSSSSKMASACLVTQGWSKLYQCLEYSLLSTRSARLMAQGSVSLGLARPINIIRFCKILPQLKQS